MTGVITGIIYILKSEHLSACNVKYFLDICNLSFRTRATWRSFTLYRKNLRPAVIYIGCYYMSAKIFMKYFENIMLKMAISKFCKFCLQIYGHYCLLIISNRNIIGNGIG